MDNNPSIHAAAKSGDAATVRRFLAADRRLVVARDQYKRTPLHHAADAVIARLLIDHGADVKAQGALHDSAAVTALAYNSATGLVWAGLENGELKPAD